MARVLAIGAHPDDAELGCGGALAKHAAAGDSVHILVLGGGASSRDGSGIADQPELRHQAVESAKVLGVGVEILNYPDQRLDSIDMLDIVKTIEGVVALRRPDIVYTHHRGDLNLDHVLTHRAVRTACRPLSGRDVRGLYAFEVASSSEWGTGFWPTSFVNISGQPLLKKLQALTCYVGEMREAPHPRSPQALSWLARWRGATMGVEAAEAFEVVWEIR